MPDFELKLKTGRLVIWDGPNGEAASKAYETSHPDSSVVAWRDYPHHGLFIGVRPIVEPGSIGWGKS